ncbi:MAG: hypothetical protein JO104_03150 [Candidatus Eremiobacteraeota bacterium]|nr:hypothetical protein [Candidatus Eremiobacteraeota bacterium]
MEIQEMKDLWAQSNRKLEASLRLNTVLLQQWNLRKADSSLKRLARGIAFELIVNVVGIVLIGAFIADHLREPQFLVPAVMLDAYGIALSIAAARQLAQLNAVDYDEAVVVIQRKVEQLRVSRIRATLWTLLFAPLMWLPLLIVAFRGLFGIDVYVAGPAWIAANVLFGLALIPLATFAAKRYGPRLNQLAPIRALADAIAGRSLTTALRSLDATRRFEEDAG